VALGLFENDRVSEAHYFFSNPAAFWIDLTVPARHLVSMVLVVTVASSSTNVPPAIRLDDFRQVPGLHWFLLKSP
jgi:hypothetical protein